MATKVRVVLNPAGIANLLKTDPGIAADLKARSEAIKDKADSGVQGQGPHHAANVWTGKDRQRATVRTVSRAAKVAEAEDHNLMKALDAGRSP
jgi:hypothetical protein